MTSTSQPAVLDALTAAIIPGRTYVIDPHDVIPQLAANPGVAVYTGPDSYSIHMRGKRRYGWYGDTDAVNAHFTGKVWAGQARSINHAHRQQDAATGEPVVMIIAGTVEDAVRVAVGDLTSAALRSEIGIAQSAEQDAARLARIAERGGRVLRLIDGAVLDGPPAR